MVERLLYIDDNKIDIRPVDLDSEADADVIDKRRIKERRALASRRLQRILLNAAEQSGVRSFEIQGREDLTPNIVDEYVYNAID